MSTTTYVIRPFGGLIVLTVTPVLPPPLAVVALVQARGRDGVVADVKGR